MPLPRRKRAGSDGGDTSSSQNGIHLFIADEQSSMSTCCSMKDLFEGLDFPPDVSIPEEIAALRMPRQPHDKQDAAAGATGSGRCRTEEEHEGLVRGSAHLALEQYGHSKKRSVLNTRQLWQEVQAPSLSSCGLQRAVPSRPRSTLSNTDLGKGSHISVKGDRSSVSPALLDSVFEEAGLSELMSAVSAAGHERGDMITRLRAAGSACYEGNAMIHASRGLEGLLTDRALVPCGIIKDRRLLGMVFSGGHLLSNGVFDCKGLNEVYETQEGVQFKIGRGCSSKVLSSTLEGPVGDAVRKCNGTVLSLAGNNGTVTRCLGQQIKDGAHTKTLEIFHGFAGSANICVFNDTDQLSLDTGILHTATCRKDSKGNWTQSHHFAKMVLGQKVTEFRHEHHWRLTVGVGNAVNVYASDGFGRWTSAVVVSSRPHEVTVKHEPADPGDGSIFKRIRRDSLKLQPPRTTVENVKGFVLGVYNGSHERQPLWNPGDLIDYRSEHSSPHWLQGCVLRNIGEDQVLLRVKAHGRGHFTTAAFEGSNSIRKRSEADAWPFSLASRSRSCRPSFDSIDEDGAFEEKFEQNPGRSSPLALAKPSFQEDGMPGSGSEEDAVVVVDTKSTSVFQKFCKRCKPRAWGGA